MFEAGSVLGGYELLGRLGGGGVADVFVAVRRGAAGFWRHVAIKVIHPHLAQEPKFVTMLVDEARVCARLNHPNIVQVEELGEDQGTIYLVMELVHGATLEDLLNALEEKRQRLPVPVAVRIALDVAAALGAAHEALDEKGAPLGIVHRDVTPSNVLLSCSGLVKLIDFGIAKATGRIQQTRPGFIKGKLPYMSPEQASAGTLDARSDLYALGIVLWEMLAGRRFFRAESEKKLHGLVARPPAPIAPGSLQVGIPLALDAAVLAALSPRPEDRPASAHAFRKLLCDACPEALRVEARELAAIVNGALGPELVKKEQALSGQASEALRLARIGRAPQSVRPPSGAVPLDAPRAPRLDAKRIHSAERPVPGASRGRGLLIAIALLGLAIGAVAGFLLRHAP